MEWADNFTGLQHIGIPTNDMDKTVEFYKKIGFEVAHETKDGDVRVVFLKFRDLILETYENKEAMKTIQNVFVILFSIMNGYVILPFIFKKLEQINNDEIEKEKITKSIIFLVATIIFIFVFETSYFGNIQNNILTMINR